MCAQSSTAFAFCSFRTAPFTRFNWSSICGRNPAEAARALEQIRNQAIAALQQLESHDQELRKLSLPPSS
jgi:hypothetical protein